MREIIFRGQTIYKSKNNAWYKGSLITESEGAKIVYDTKDKNGWEYVIPKTVGQYTGLEDKNGNKIFEGDIFKFKDEILRSSYNSYDSWGVENYAVVGYNEETARFDFVKYKFDENSVDADLHENHDLEFADFVSELEIVGNIHDNPEMMKGE